MNATIKKTVNATPTITRANCKLFIGPVLPALVYDRLNFGSDWTGITKLRIGASSISGSGARDLV
jgi:hypothetical protein